MALTLKLDDIKPLLGAVGFGQDPTPAPKPVNDIPPPPMQMPPTPAAAGFSEWASDPQNAKKVTDGITQPGTPLLPPAPPPSLGANMPPPPQMASVNPPPGKDMSFLTPPSMPGPPPSMGASTPNFSQQTKMNADIANNPDAYQKPMLKHAGLVGNLLNFGTAGLLGAAGGLHGDPGAGANWVAQQAANDRGIPAANAAQYDLRNVKPLQQAAQAKQAEAQLADTESQTAQRTALGAKAQAQADNVGDDTKIKSKQVSDAAKLGMTPAYDEKGALTGFAPDPNSPITKSRTQKDALVEAQVTDTQAQNALRQAQTEVEKAKNDPKSPAYQLAIRKLGVAQQNASAATVRAQTTRATYMQQAYGTGLNGETLAGTTQIANDAGDVTNVGARNAGQATKAQGKAAQFKDVGGSLDQLDGALRDLHASGGSLSSPAVIASLQDTKTPVAEWLQSKAASTLSPQERNAVVAVKSSREQIMAMRSSVGGGISDSQINRLVDQLPGPSTPDYDTASRQIGTVRGSLGRLAPGAPTVTGGLAIPGKGKGITPPPTGGATPTEGQTKVNSHGDKVKFSGGKWGPA